jgi:uncharacterized membrane protein YfcA
VEAIDLILAAAMGLAGGMVGGLLGVGGGILFVPALAIFADLTQVEAESTSLLAIVGVAILGTWRQRQYGNVRLADGLLIGVLSLLGVGLGVVVANEVSQRALELGFAALALLIAARLAARALRSPSAGDARAAPDPAAPDG